MTEIKYWNENDNLDGDGDNADSYDDVSKIEMIILKYK